MPTIHVQGKITTLTINADGVTLEVDDDGVIGRSMAPAPAPKVLCDQVVVPSFGHGDLPEYTVLLFNDGSALCRCADFWYRGAAHADDRYQCKHIRHAWVGR